MTREEYRERQAKEAGRVGEAGEGGGMMDERVQAQIEECIQNEGTAEVWLDGENVAMICYQSTRGRYSLADRFESSAGEDD